MTGPEHYAEAERLAEVYKQALADAAAIPNESRDLRFEAFMDARTLLSKASVHATLALAAATIDAAEGVSADWTRVVAP